MSAPSTRASEGRPIEQNLTPRNPRPRSLAVTALSGSVGEVLALGAASGGSEDLLFLQVRASERRARPTAR